MSRIASIGDIVHYVSYGTPGGEYGKECRAAIVTEVSPENKSEDLAAVVGLCVLNPTGQFFNRGVEYHDGAETPDHRTPPRTAPDRHRRTGSRDSCAITPQLGIRPSLVGRTATWTWAGTRMPSRTPDHA